MLSSILEELLSYENQSLSLYRTLQAGLHQETGVDDEVRNTAFWGAVMLDQ
jgi:hypothetical protein